MSAREPSRNRAEPTTSAAISISVTTSVTVVPTTSPESANCRRPTKTWAFPGRGHLRNRAEPTGTNSSISAPMPAAAAPQPLRQRPVVSSPEYVGSVRHGDFTQSGGTNHSCQLSLSRQQRLTAAARTASAAAASCRLAPQYVGSSGTGTFTQCGGTNTVTGTLYLGDNAGGSGTYNLSGGVLLLSALSQGPGTAAFNFNGGTVRASMGFPPVCPWRWEPAAAERLSIRPAIP